MELYNMSYLYLRAFVNDELVEKVDIDLFFEIEQSTIDEFNELPGEEKPHRFLELLKIERATNKKLNQYIISYAHNHQGEPMLYEDYDKYLEILSETYNMSIDELNELLDVTDENLTYYYEHTKNQHTTVKETIEFKKHIRENIETYRKMRLGEKIFYLWKRMTVVDYITIMIAAFIIVVDDKYDDDLKVYFTLN